METRKLYYENSRLTDFKATVLSCQQVKNGWEVILDATAFYPEGGGQACDIGTLGSAMVEDVQERGDQVIHLCDEALPVGQTVEGCVNWDRRLDLMQQHTGEHIVSGIIHRIFGYHNVGFHMGEHMVTIDFDGPIQEAILIEIERQANEAVWQDIPVKCWYPSPEELPHVGYRSKKDLPWPVRVVEIPGYDKCACCGVHTQTTGQIGMIKILSCVKFHQGVRIEMVCGDRALAYMNQIYDQNRQISQQLSAKPLYTAKAVEALRGQLVESKYREVMLKRRLFKMIAEGYRGEKTLLHIEPELDPGDVRLLADTVAECCSGVAAVASGTDETGYSLCLVSQTRDVRPLGKEAFGALKGRGGGKEACVQGSVKATEAQIRAFFEDLFGKNL